MKYARNSKTQSLLLVVIVYFLAFFAAVATYRLLPGEYSLLAKTLWADVAATIVVFLFSFLFNNSSLYDPYWSVAPPVIFTFWLTQAQGGVAPLRNIVILMLTLVWGIRLTINWAVGWPGLIHEDWRYVSFREKFKTLYWPISFLGIHFFRL